MNILIFGATGMVGQGVLRECFLAPDVARVQTVGRNPTGAQHAKLTEIVRADLYHYDDIAPQLTGFNACFFTLGVTSAGKKKRSTRTSPTTSPSPRPKPSPASTHR